MVRKQPCDNPLEISRWFNEAKTWRKEAYQSSQLQSLRAQRHCRIHAGSRPRWHENRN